MAGSRLPPEQLLDVARQSCNPRPANNGGGNGGNSPVTPTPPAPVSFTPLPDSILLPFINRPAEVSQLMSTPPSAKLFALLAQTFPADARTPSGSETVDSLLARDAKTWTYGELQFWMKTVDRDVADDMLWTWKARTCIMAKSELIWERIKGALGVPAELDVEEETIPSVLEPADPAQTTEGESYPSVFESSSPLLSIEPSSPSLNSLSLDELSIEPVIATNTVHPPTSSALDPSATHELTEVREEDENEDALGESALADGSAEEPEVHGLRIMTSPATPVGSNYAFSPVGSPSPLPLGSPATSPMTIPRAASMHEDVPYDALQERGPGHPLFPSSFAHLSMAPTLRPNSHFSRAQSLWNPPAPAFGSPHSIRTGVQRAASTHGLGGGFRRPDWAQAYDPARHEFAVASSAGSVSGIE